MLAVLSCNGGTVTSGATPATRVLVATLRGVRAFERDGADAAWRPAGAALEDLHISALLFEPSSQLVFAGAHGDGGLWMSADLGASWTRRDEGIATPHIYTLAAQPRDGGVRLLTGCEPVALYASDDLGASWRALPNLTQVPGTEHWTFPPPPHLAHVKNVAFHPARPNELYVCVEQGALLKSDDDGATWHEIDSYASSEDFFRNDNHRVLIKPSDSNVLFMSGGEGLYRSQNAGVTWTHLTTRDDRIGYPDALFLDPRDENALFMAGPRHPPRTWGVEKKADPTVLHSTDNGESWRELRDGLPDVIIGNIEGMGLYQHHDVVMLLAGTATGEVFASEDAGAHWTTLADGLPPISKGGHYRWFLSPEQRERIEEGMRG